MQLVKFPTKHFLKSNLIFFKCIAMQYPKSFFACTSLRTGCIIIGILAIVNPLQRTVSYHVH